MVVVDEAAAVKEVEVAAEEGEEAISLIDFNWA